MKKNKKTYPIDPRTGLPTLPKGHYWEVDGYGGSLSIDIRNEKNHFVEGRGLYLKDGVAITKEFLVETATEILRKRDYWAAQDEKRDKKAARKKAIRAFLWNLIFMRTLRVWIDNRKAVRMEAHKEKIRLAYEERNRRYDEDRLKLAEALKAAEQFRGKYPPKNLNDM